MQKILLVDDEQNVLNALRRELKDHFEIETFDNPVSALERCGENHFDLVVSDYKMPEMNGLEFLKRFGQIHPDSARIVLSGEADIDALLRTINETHIYRFIAKPWEKADLLSSIQQALAYREATLENRRQADTYRSKHATTESTPDVPVYRIVLVLNDDHLPAIISRSLTEESGSGSLYGAMQSDFAQNAEGTAFKCEVHAFRTAEAALAHAVKHDCDLIIAAQALPDMDGIKLLSKMKQAQPDVARILISNDPDKSALSQAINVAEVRSVLELHWNSYELRADARRQAWNLYQLKMAVIQALDSRSMLIENKRLAALG
ncbi:MAG: response regulator [Gallionella sp.]|nr:response regulator [Gallionella sp.]